MLTPLAYTEKASAIRLAYLGKVGVVSPKTLRLSALTGSSQQTLFTDGLLHDRLTVLDLLVLQLLSRDPCMTGLLLQ